jgi:basic membrane protein A
MKSRSEAKWTNYALRIRHYWLIAIVCFSITACQPINCFDKDVFCAALVTDTLGIDDYGISQEIWVGLQESKAEGLTQQVAYIESVDTRDYQKNIAYFANRGYDLIITNGIGLQDETEFSALAYPNVIFVGFNQIYEEPRPNIISVSFAEDQMGFVAGALATKISKTGIVAGVCETSGIDSMWRYCEGFRNGALFTNPQIKVLIAYRDDGDREKLFIDETWGYESASSFIERGADVLFSAGGVTGQGALKAASEFGIYAIGSERNQFVALGESGSGVVTSFYGESRKQVKELMRFVKEGLIPPPRIGQMQFVSFNQSFPESIGFEIQLLITLLENGEIYTNVSLEKP